MTAARPTCGLLIAALAACTLAPGPGTTPGATAADALPPPGYGTLRQDEVTIALTSGDLQIHLTPLAPAVTRVTAPDTERRLSGLAQSHGDAGSALFLVSFHSEQPDVRFVPEEVQIVSRGLRLRPSTVTPITPTWGQRRLRQRETEMAVYAFDGEVDLESELTVVYGLVQSTAWSTILPRIQAERARARARAGVGAPALEGRRRHPYSPRP